jgi:hypothetical protein
MKQSVFLVVTLIFAGCMIAPLPALSISVGDTADEVVSELGPPDRLIQINNSQTMYFERGIVEIADDLVISADLISEAALVKRLEREAVERAIREEELRIQRERRMQEGAEALELKLEDSNFISASAAKRLAYWREFRRKYPEIAMPEDYFVALREREFELREAGLEQRVRDLEARAARAQAAPPEQYQVSYSSSPYYVSSPVVYSGYANRTCRGYGARRSHYSHRGSRHGYHHDRGPRVVPYHSTAGYGFQRPLGHSRTSLTIKSPGHGLIKSRGFRSSHRTTSGGHRSGGFSTSVSAGR